MSKEIVEIIVSFFILMIGIVLIKSAAILVLIFIIGACIYFAIYYLIIEPKKKLEPEILQYLNLSNLLTTPDYDIKIIVNNKIEVYTYNVAKFFQEYTGNILEIKKKIENRYKYVNYLKVFLQNNPFESRIGYSNIEQKIINNINNIRLNYRILVIYNESDYKYIDIDLLQIAKAINLINQEELKKQKEIERKEELEKVQREIEKQVKLKEIERQRELERIQKEIERKEKLEKERKINELESKILSYLKLDNLLITPQYDIQIDVKSKRAVDNYDDIKFCKDYNDNLLSIKQDIENRYNYVNYLYKFLQENDFKTYNYYPIIEKKIISNINNIRLNYQILVSYVSPAGNSTAHKTLCITLDQINKIIENNEKEKNKIKEKNQRKLIAEQEKSLINEKQNLYYTQINEIITLTNSLNDRLVINEDAEKLDNLISKLFTNAVSNIKKIKKYQPEEFKLIENYINDIRTKVNEIENRNVKIINYYNSNEFIKIKNTVNALMESQKEFNEYIDEKIKSIETLFGKRVIRNETVIEDTYNYIRPYKKMITPFTAEVSDKVFSSAENNPMGYIVKYFYPNKEQYPEQIQKLQVLIEELETLKDAKQIIENYKKEYQQYLLNVPKYVLDLDEDGFYSKLGFANITEKNLTVEYKFVYTSQGGFVQRYFTVPMTEETIIELIDTLQSKLTQEAFSKEQRRLMTSKLRQEIKERDNYTCQMCGNSIYKEPNLLLEIDHKLPIAEGGYTVENNLQTLCWKCNRSKGHKIIDYKGIEVKKIESKKAENYKTTISNREAIFTDDHLKIGNIILAYNKMKNIKYRNGDKSGFIFEYEGKNILIPCSADEKSKMMPYFQKAVKKK